MTVLNVTTNGSIRVLELNRPDKRNALNFEMVSELKLAFGKAEEDESVKVIVLNANGEVFSAGAGSN